MHGNLEALFPSRHPILCIQDSCIIVNIDKSAIYNKNNNKKYISSC